MFIEFFMYCYLIFMICSLAFLVYYIFLVLFRPDQAKKNETTADIIVITITILTYFSNDDVYTRNGLLLVCAAAGRLFFKCIKRPSQEPKESVDL